MPTPTEKGLRREVRWLLGMVMFLLLVITCLATLLAT